MFVFVSVCITYVLSSLAIILAGCFAIIGFWLSCYCKCPVALTHSAMGWLWHFLIILIFFLLLSVLCVNTDGPNSSLAN